MLKVVAEDQVRSSLQIAELIGEIRSAFAKDLQSSLQMPTRTQCGLGDSVLLLMPCHDSSLGAAGIKIVAVSPQAGVNATYVLLDPASGKIRCVIESNYLTDVRTAATSAVATDLLARKDAHTVGIFGSGRQAMAHLIVLPHVRAFRRFLVCGVPGSDLGSFVSRIKQEHGIQVEAVNGDTCAGESDVLCTCTTAPEPLFDGRLLRPGTHLNLVGAFQPHTREVDDETIRRSRIVVDTYEGALSEAGDLLIPLNDRTITRQHILADLHQLATGKKQVRTSSDDITLFKSVGCALEDLVAAMLVHKEVCV